MSQYELCRWREEVIAGPPRAAPRSAPPRAPPRSAPPRAGPRSAPRILAPTAGKEGVRGAAVVGCEAQGKARRLHQVRRS